MYFLFASTVYFCLMHKDAQGWGFDLPKFKATQLDTNFNSKQFQNCIKLKMLLRSCKVSLSIFFFVALGLTDEHILKLSKHVTSLFNLNNLGVRVLGLTLEEVNSAQTDCKYINESAAAPERGKNQSSQALTMLCSSSEILSGAI